MRQPTIECDIFDYVTVNGRISKKLCEKVFVAKINELESKLKQQQELVDKLEKEVTSLKKKTGYTTGFWMHKCNNCGHDSSREN